MKKHIVLAVIATAAMAIFKGDGSYLHDLLT